MDIQKLRQEVPMRYWSLPSGVNYKNRFQKALDNGDYILTKKMDGVLYRFSKSEQDSILQSRTISRKTKQLVEKQDNVPAIMEQLNQLPNNTMVLGEICFVNPSKTSKEVISIMGCLPPKAITRQKENPVMFYIFDVMAYDGLEIYNLPYQKRLEILRKIEGKHNFNELISFVETFETNIQEHIANLLSSGAEGTVLMHYNKPYVFKKRPAWTAIKIKQEITETLDLVIMGTTNPTKEYTGKYPQSWNYWENVKTGELVEGNFYKDGGYLPISENYFQGKIGGLVLGAYSGDNLLQVCKIANLTDELRTKITNNLDSFMGKVVKVNAMSIDKELRSLRHPKFVGFHPDKNPKECLYGDVFK